MAIEPQIKPTSALGGLGKKKEVTAPNKQTMSFVHTQSSFKPGRVIPVVLLLAVLALAVLKFGVIDQEQLRTQARNELSIKQQESSLVQAQLKDYDALAAEYGRYSFGLMNDTEIGLVDRMQALELLEKQVMKKATVKDFALNGNVLTLNICNVTLERASQIVKELEESPLVKSAAVYSASADDAQEASIFMSIMLTKEEAAQ